LIDGLFPGAIARVNEDGSELETIVSGLSEPWGIAVDLTAGTFYWTDVLLGRGGVIRRADLDGSNVLDVVDGLLDPRGVALDTLAKQIYWADLAAGKIQRSSFDGGETVDLLSKLDRPQSLVLYSRPDFNGDGVLDVRDISLLASAVATGIHEPRLDINDDGFTNFADVELWIHDVRRTWFGDANLDGEFNSTDFVEVFVAGRYETGLAADWSQGDWNVDAKFDTSDFVLAFQDGGYEIGLRTEAGLRTVAVPEPNASLPILFVFLVYLLFLFQRRDWAVENVILTRVLAVKFQAVFLSSDFRRARPGEITDRYSRP
jgi:hypothetical protein